ncbi:sensor histidine kinase [Nonomuraea africana]|uniref:histidine kinase n=2 Tax=Nonomuraea TaxID=83681 RepID=A0ABR9KW71_9ACTN|nr:histidine kinase [Nonomuraea africana]MBE1566296.1 signal transduction histidine kinase [Nonomuraea africana]
MFGKIRAWSQRHPMVVDALWLMPLIGLCVMTATSYTAPVLAPLGLAGYLALSTALLVPLFWRGSHPRVVFAIVSLISFFQWLAAVDAFPANAAVLVALYSVATRCPFRWALAAGLVAELGVFLALVHWDSVTFSMFFGCTVFTLTIWLTGLYANTRRRYLEGLEERAARAERERDQQARMAAAAERARIARELHDVVAHNVSVIIVQADGAGYAIDSDPEQARRAVRAISKTGRQALAEMRRMVGVLREDGSGAADYTPQPGLAQLEELVRGSGLPVDLRVTGVPQELPEGEQLAIYRLVQEALTNTLKHGGPGARALVEMEYGMHELVVRVTDDGRGAAAPRSPDGHGLLGMRERVSMYGGAVQAAPRPGGGFEVLARLPVAA